MPLGCRILIPLRPLPVFCGSWPQSASGGNLQEERCPLRRLEVEAGQFLGACQALLSMFYKKPSQEETRSYMYVYIYIHVHLDRYRAYLSKRSSFRSCMLQRFLESFGGLRKYVSMDGGMDCLWTYGLSLPTLNLSAVSSSAGRLSA